MIKRMEMGKRMSQAVVHGGVVYLAGQVAEDTSLDIVGQTGQALAAVERLLAEAGSSKAQLLTMAVYLADIGEFAGMNSVYDSWIDPDNKPTRACVQALLADPGYKVEFVATAAVA